MIQIGKDVRVEASEYKGKFYVHIRKWWSKDGVDTPGKGIALNMDEWKEFIDKYQEICDDINKEINYK